MCESLIRSKLEFVESLRDLPIGPLAATNKGIKNKGATAGLEQSSPTSSPSSVSSLTDVTRAEQADQTRNAQTNTTQCRAMAKNCWHNKHKPNTNLH